MIRLIVHLLPVRLRVGARSSCGRVLSATLLASMAVREQHETRFAFGKNWARYLSVLNEDRIRDAGASLTQLLGPLAGLRFLDAGCGSGLFSLAAHRAGATVHSLDIDPESVGCAQRLREQFGTGGPAWTIEQADLLDRTHLEALGQFDVVYSWGVLHHTGSMWEALDNAAMLVGDAGRLYVSLYNDRGVRTDRWRAVKRTYNRLPEALRTPYVVLVMAPFELKLLLASLLRLRPQRYLRTWTEKRYRGMSRWHDMVDWVGGYPFETAKPEDVLVFCRDRGFDLVGLITNSGQNQFVFQRR